MADEGLLCLSIFSRSIPGNGQFVEKPMHMPRNGTVKKSRGRKGVSPKPEFCGFERTRRNSSRVHCVDSRGNFGHPFGSIHRCQRLCAFSSISLDLRTVCSRSFRLHDRSGPSYVAHWQSVYFSCFFKPLESRGRRRLFFGPCWILLRWWYKTFPVSLAILTTSVEIHSVLIRADFLIYKSYHENRRYRSYIRRNTWYSWE